MFDYLGRVMRAPFASVSRRCAKAMSRRDRFMKASYYFDLSGRSRTSTNCWLAAIMTMNQFVFAELVNVAIKFIYPEEFYKSIFRTIKDI